MRTSICVLAVISLLAFACTGCDSSSESDVYDLSLMEEDGAPVYAGTLDLRFEENGTDGSQPLTGTWRLAPVGEGSPLAASAGAVQGDRLGNGVGLRLDMGASDTGLQLDGTMNEDQIVGAWSAITIAGPQPRGTFEAVRR